jgi:hypothetical protein
MASFSERDFSIDRADKTLDQLHHLVADSEDLVEDVLRGLVTLQIYNTEHEVCPERPGAATMCWLTSLPSGVWR